MRMRRSRISLSGFRLLIRLTECTVRSRAVEFGSCFSVGYSLVVQQSEDVVEEEEEEW